MARDVAIDAAKGIGIFLVVLGHHPFAFHDYIYSFHIPLFFVISGFFFREEKSLVGRVKPLLVAFLFYYVLSALKALVVGGVQDDVVGAVRVCLSGELADGPIWFLLALAEVCLFVKVLFWLVRNDALRLLLSVVIFAVVCCLGASVSFNPLFFFQAMAMQFFYVCGYFMYNKTFRGGDIPYNI